jgi:regulation of enolase protein 1 (concanavalin A-like superfamily)
MNPFAFRVARVAASIMPARPMGGLFFALLLGGFVSVPFAQAQLYTETSSLFGDATSDHRFGLTVAASQNTIVVGTPSGPLHGDRDAYVFVRYPSGWVLQQKLGFPTSDVAIDANTLVGGGKVYVRSGTTWTPQSGIAVLEHPQAAVQGNTLVLGNPYDRTQERGGVLVYVRSGSTWTQQADLRPDAGAGAADQMGSSVALDGNTLVAGTSAGAGGAYVFVRSGTTWTKQARLPLPTGTGWNRVALEGDTAVVGDPGYNVVHIFTRSGTTWTLAQTISRPAGGMNFGRQVSLDGGVLGVGAGTVYYLFTKTSSGWTLAQTISRPNYTNDGGLALANDGKLFVIGNPTDDTKATNAGIVEAFSVPATPPPESGWRDYDVGAVGLAGGHAPDGWATDVRGSGADIWNRADQFHFLADTLTGDGRIVVRVNSVGGGNFWAKAGIMFREDLTTGSKNVMALVTSGGPAGLQVRSTTAGTTEFRNAGWLGAPLYLLLTRAGDVFTAYQSVNGYSDWTSMGSVTVSMPPTLYVGLAVTSHDNTVLNTANFVDVDVWPIASPEILYGSNLGFSMPPGSFSTSSDGVLTIDAQGQDIWAKHDFGYFVNRTITGDFDIRARITSLTNTHAWAKAGIMVRESGDLQARNVFTMLSAGAVAGMQVRTTHGGETTFTSGPWVGAPYWVRLVRTGDSFESLVSANGTTWQRVGTVNLALPARLQAGIAVSSHTGANITTRATVESLDFGD